MSTEDRSKATKLNGTDEMSGTGETAAMALTRAELTAACRDAELAAAGGSAQVLRGVHPHETLAFKVIREDAPAIYKQALRRERRCYEALQDASETQAPATQCVPRFIAALNDSALVLTWVEGQDCGALLESREFDTHEVERIAQGVLRGLAFLHKAGFAHRDVKLSNLRLDSRADPHKDAVLLDFGDAAPFFSSPAHGGTPECWSPERYCSARVAASPGREEGLRGTCSGDSVASDLYSAGLLVFAALCRVNLTRDKTTGEHKLEPVRAFRRDLGAAADPIDAFFGRALAADREARFESASAMLASWTSALALIG